MNRDGILEYFKPLLNEKELTELSVWTKHNEAKFLNIKNNFTFDRLPLLDSIKYSIWYGSYMGNVGKCLQFIVKV